MAFHKIKKQNHPKLGISHAYLSVLLFTIFALTMHYFFIKPKWYFKRQELIRTCTDCEQAKKQALKDIAKGQFCFVQFGLLTDKSAAFLEMLENEYHVLAISGGCVGGGGDIQCYNQIMVETVEAKFGRDIFIQR
jgi:hypothetical protein